MRRQSVLSERVKAAFVVSDPVDWGRDIQVLILSLSFFELSSCCIGVGRTFWSLFHTKFFHLYFLFFKFSNFSFHTPNKNKFSPSKLLY